MKEIPLTKGFVAVVDDDDHARVAAAGKWSAYAMPGKAVYARKAINANGRATSISLHRFITGWPLVDHINGDGLDNRKSNLRPATSKQNAANRRIPNVNTSGYKGVSRHTGGRWRARLGTSPIINVGTFATREEAARAYDTAAIETWGEFARLNFPQEQEQSA